ncbi:MAG: glycosyltransferase [candidate division WOR-3 bacterium]
MEIRKKRIIASIIIDTYNYGRFIEDAIDSVLNQTFPQKDMEIIVVDDGSTDNTSQIVKKYKDKIKYIYKENRGQASALNLGIENSKGEYLVFLDADDFCSPQRVERVVEEFEKYENVVQVNNGFKFVNKNGKEIDFAFWKPNFYEFHNLSLNRKNIYLFFSSFAPMSAIALRKGILKYILPFPEKSKIGADMCIDLVAMWFGNLSFLKEELTYYRIHGDNLWSTNNTNKFKLHVEAMENAFLYLKKIVKNSKIYDPVLFKKALKLWEIAMEQKRINLKPKEREKMIKIEIEKFGAYSENYSISRRLYKFATLPYLILLILFSPGLYTWLKNFYSKREFFKKWN